MQTRTLTLLALAGAAFIAAPALGQGQPADQPQRPAQPPPAEAPPQVEPAPAIEAAPAVQPEPRFTLLESGEEPRRALRYDIDTKARQETKVTMAMSSSVSMDGTQMPGQSMPKLELLMHVDAENGENGVNEVRGELVEAEARPEAEEPEGDQMAQLLNQALRQMTGLAMVSRVDERGVIRSTTTEPPTGVDPQFIGLVSELEQPMTQIGIHFPEEEIGEGARWRVLIPSTSQGVTIQQTIEYELTSLNGNVAEVQLTLSQTAEPQQMGTAELKSMSGEGSGSATVDLRRAAALKSEAELISRLEMVMSELGDEHDVVQTVTLKTSVASDDLE